MKNAKPKSGFSVFTRRDGAYNMMHVSIMANYEDSFRDATVSIQYQADSENLWRFYGGRLIVEAESLTDLEKIHRFVAKVFKKQKASDPKPMIGVSNFRFHSNPVEVLECLKAVMPQVVNDCRTSAYTPIDQLPRAELRAYRDDYRAYGQSSCSVGCLAESEDEARHLLTAKFAEYNYRSSRERFDLWLKAGRPVMRLSESQWAYPEFETVDSILAKIADAHKESETATSEQAA